MVNLTMAAIVAYELTDGSRRYYVKYRDAAHRQHKKSGFRTKRAAQDYAARMETSITDGTWVNPAKGQTTVNELAVTWLQGKQGVSKPKYYADLKSAWRVHVQPKWGSRPISSIRRSEVQQWISGLATKRSATVVLRAFTIIKGICDDAVADRLMVDTPCRDITLPHKPQKPRNYLNAAQVIELAGNSEGHDALVLTLGFCGLRWGEAKALRVDNVDFERKRLEIRSSITTVNGEDVETATKTWEHRQVPVPDLVLDALKALCAGKRGDEHVFLERDGSLIRTQTAKGNRRTWWRRALNAAGVPVMRCHDLRHTAASIAISCGANVKAVQRMLGHKSAAMTLDTYADLFDTDLDDVAATVNKRISEVVEGMKGTKKVPV